MRDGTAAAFPIECVINSAVRPRLCFTRGWRLFVALSKTNLKKNQNADSGGLEASHTVACPNMSGPVSGLRVSGLISN